MVLPEVVVFDLGKVLVDFDYSKATRQIAARGKMDAATVNKFIDHSPLLFRFETGLMTKEQFFAEVQSETGFSGDFEEFRGMFVNIFEPIPKMLELHATLRRKQIPTYIFSNTNELQLPHIRQSYPFFQHFDGYVLSYEHGAMKPNPRLYEVVERETQRRGAQILYIDDRAENVAAGAARGWQVILQENPDKTMAAVRQVGLLA